MPTALLIVAVAWMYVVLMVALVEAMDGGSVVGVVFTVIGWGVLPLAVLLYILSTPLRKRARAAAAQASPQPDGGSHAAGDAVAPEREEP